MAKEIKKKSPKKAASIFYGVIAASVKENPKPKSKQDKNKDKW